MNIFLMSLYFYNDFMGVMGVWISEFLYYLVIFTKHIYHHTWSTSPEKSKYVTASDASEVSTLCRALVGVQGAKPPENFTFLILKIP